jgi:uncharacterized protein (UPF0261 family)
LYDPPMESFFVEILKQGLNSKIDVLEKDSHINDPAFADAAAHLMDRMVSGGGLPEYRISNKE